MPWAGELILLAGLAVGAMPVVTQASPSRVAAEASNARTKAREGAAAAAMAEGQRAFGVGNFAQAYAIWTDLAEQGDTAALMLVAGMLDRGIGVERDSAAALRWYGIAAERGVTSAELDAGIMLDSGRGASRDVAAAATYYARAAARGNRRAQYNIGQLYAAGEGVPLNPAAARAWYNLAAHNGIEAATAKLTPMPPVPMLDHPPSQLTPASDLHQAVMQTPLGDKSVMATPAGGVEFVWLAPAQPVPVTFYMEVAAVDGKNTHPVASRYVAETAVVLDLGTTSRDYIWRVYVVDQRRQRYVAAKWQRFSVTSPTSPHD